MKKNNLRAFAKKNVRRNEQEEKKSSHRLICDAKKFASTKKALLESRQKYKDLVENINDAIYYLDKKGNFIYVSPVIRQISGYDAKELFGHSIFEFMHPEDVKKGKDKFKEVLSGKSKPFDARIIKKDGSVGYVRSFGRLLLDRNKKVRGIISVLNDITERKKAEEALRKSEEQFRNIYENAPLGIFHTTPDGKIIRVNPAFADMLKYNSPEELMEEVNKTNIAKRMYVNQGRRSFIIGKVMRFPGWHRFENYYKCKNGKTIIAAILLRKIIDPITQKEELEGFMEDITERKKAEEASRESRQKYQDLIENINDAIFQLDNRGKFLYISPVIRQIAGFYPKEIVGHYFQEFVHPDDLLKAKSKFEEAFSGNMKPIEIRIIKKDGSYAYARISGRLMFKDEKIKGINAILTDITERKKAEARLIESYKYLGTINRQVSVLLELNKVSSESKKRDIVDFITWSALEISNSKFAALYKLQSNGEKKNFHLMSMASITEIEEKEKNRILHLSLESPECIKEIEDDMIEKMNGIEKCFKETKLKEFRLNHSIDHFYTLPIIDKKELAGILVLGIPVKREITDQEKGFLGVFAKYATFILLDTGALK